ncbi:MAG: CHAT domain-containing tetratricopeptide repeat protein [Bacteroidota bacterium]
MLKSRTILFLVMICLQAVAVSSPSDQLRAILAKDQSMQRKQQSLDSLTRLINDEKTMEAADFFHDLGFQWYFKRCWKTVETYNYLDSAINCFRHAATIKQALASPNKESIVRSLYNMGVCYSLKAAYFQAINAYQQIVDLNQQDRRMLNALREIGNMYNQTGDYYRALENFRKMTRLSKSLGLDLYIGLSFVKRAVTYSEIDRTLYNDSIRVNLNKASRFLTVDDINEWYLLQNAEANRLQDLGHYKDAIAIYMRLVSDPQTANTNYLSLIHSNLGYLHFRTDNLTLAKKHLKQSLDYNDRLSFAYENLGDVLLQEKNYDRALLAYDGAIDAINVPSEDRVDFSTSSFFRSLSHLSAKANALLTIYEETSKTPYLEKAFDTFYEADSLVDEIRFQSTEYKSKLYWREQSAKLYLNAVKTCHLLQKPEAAYYFMEKNKALLLLEELSNEQAKASARLPDRLAAREFHLKQAIHQFNHRLKNTKDDKSLKDQVYQAKRSYEQFVDSLMVAYPTYGKLKRKVEVLPYKTFKAKFTSGEKSVLHYIIGDSLSYGLLSTETGSHLYPLEDGFRKLLDAVIFWQHQPITTKVEATNYARTSSLLLSRLIPGHLLPKGPSPILLLPDGALHRLSFEALCTDSTTLQHFFIEDHVIHRAQSIALLEVISARNRRPPNEMVAFAPVQFNGLPTLEETEREAVVVSEFFDGDPLIRSQATKARFKELIDDYQIIHLATHADAALDGEPWIAFHDDQLTLTETYALPSQAELVVLGSCKTSLGILKAGEGMMSMTRGFFYSGTNSVVSTLWSANDQSTRKIMGSFYEGLSKGQTKSTALHQAKINYLNTANGSLRSPYYWAASLLVGSDRPVIVTNYLSWIIATACLTLVICLAGSFYLRKSAKK